MAPSGEELVLGAPTPESPFAGFMISPARPAPPIELRGTDGETVRLTDFEGQVVLLFFGYTFCPDVCPQTMTKLTVALRELEDRADGVTVLFVSVDPERDTPVAIEQFLAGYNSRTVGVTGDHDKLRALADAYAVTYFVDNEDSEDFDPRFYTITHSATVFMIDQGGRLRASFLGPYTPDDVAHDVTVLLDEAEQVDG
jgi:protein SCO1/2